MLQLPTRPTIRQLRAALNRSPTQRNNVRNGKRGFAGRKNLRVHFPLGQNQAADGGNRSEPRALVTSLDRPRQGFRSALVASEDARWLLLARLRVHFLFYLNNCAKYLTGLKGGIISFFSFLFLAADRSSSPSTELSSTKEGSVNYIENKIEFSYLLLCFFHAFIITGVKIRAFIQFFVRSNVLTSFFLSSFNSLGSS